MSFKIDKDSIKNIELIEIGNNNENIKEEIDIKTENLWKESLSRKDRDFVKLGSYDIMHSGGFGNEYYVGPSTSIETKREYRYGEDRIVTTRKHVEGHYKRSVNGDKSGPSIDLYSGCPLDDGIIPGILHKTTWLTLNKKTYFSWKLDSLLSNCFEQYIKCICYPGCLAIEWIGGCFSDMCECGRCYKNCLSSCTNGIDSEKTAFCVVPISEYIKQSEQIQALNAISDIRSKNLCFLKVKNGEVQSISVENNYYTFDNNNFVLTYLNLKNCPDKIPSPLYDSQNKNGHGFLTKGLTINYLSDKKYIDKVKETIKIIDPNGKYLYSYKDRKGLN